MTPKQEKQYREEFDNEWATMDLFSPTSDYGNSKLDFARVVYIEARKKAQEEIDRLNEKLAIIKEIKQYPTALAYISELKEELIRERDTVDFYASSESWNRSGYATYEERHFVKISEKMKIDCDDAENYPASIIGGKLARKTQQQRRIEL